jgi:hypothetical protein
MSDIPSLKDEYDMLVGELRQNRQIQLQAFFATPIWVSLFFGLVASGSTSALSIAPELALLPIPLALVNSLLILDRRKSSDAITADFRTAFDARMAIAPGWNLLLPTFRHNLAALKAVPAASIRVSDRIPQRFDFNMIVMLSYLLIAATCITVYSLLAPERWLVATAVTVACVLAFALVLHAHVRLANRKSAMIEAWRCTLMQREVSQAAAGEDVRSNLRLERPSALTGAS